MGNHYGDIEAATRRVRKKRVNRAVRENVTLPPMCLTTPFSHSRSPLLTHVRCADIVGRYGRASAPLKPIGKSLSLLKLAADNLQQKPGCIFGRLANPNLVEKAPASELTPEDLMSRRQPFRRKNISRPCEVG
jgi:hypothetical protein